MELSDFISVLAGLLTLSISSGLIFAILVQPLRTRINLFFALFAASVGLWSSGAIFRNLNQDVVTFDDRVQFYLQVIGLILSVISFYFFLVSFVQVKYLPLKIASLMGLPTGIIATMLVLTGDFIDWNEGDWSITPAGYILFTLGVLYLLGALWLVYQDNSEASRAMRFPAILMIGGIATNFVPALSRLPVDTTIRSIVMMIVGWQILRFQLFNPIQEMNRNLKARNEELREEKARVEELNRQLQHVSQYKDTFLASMSHELRTPLNAVIGYSEVMLQGTYGELSPKQRNRMEKIHSNALNLLELINDILDLSKIEAGRIELELAVISLPEIVCELRASIEPLCEKKNLQFVIESDENLCTIYADATRIRQVLLNLLSNAVKFTAAGSVTLKIQNAAVRNGICPIVQLPARAIEDGDWVLTGVKDTGIGIALENHERIFEAFRQADSSTTRQYGGTGLGLAIAKRFVEMHRGHIWFESEVGKGSNFYVIIPACMEQ